MEAEAGEGAGGAAAPYHYGSSSGAGVGDDDGMSIIIIIRPLYCSFGFAASSSEPRIGGHDEEDKMIRYVGLRRRT